MNWIDHPGVWIAASVLVLAILTLLLIKQHYNPDRRVSEKRRKNYGKVVASVKRPMVMLSVNTDKEKGKDRPR